MVLFIRIHMGRIYCYLLPTVSKTKAPATWQTYTDHYTSLSFRSTYAGTHAMDFTILKWLISCHIHYCPLYLLFTDMFPSHSLRYLLRAILFPRVLTHGIITRLYVTLVDIELTSPYSNQPWKGVVVIYGVLGVFRSGSGNESKHRFLLDNPGLDLYFIDLA